MRDRVGMGIGESELGVEVHDYDSIPPLGPEPTKDLSARTVLACLELGKRTGFVGIASVEVSDCLGGVL